MTNRTLVIRGGAIGDFVLTLPAIRLLREAGSEIEILGRQHILKLVEGRYYTEKTRSIDAAQLAGFFSTELNSTWCDYFASFQQVISYLFDPEEIFVKNLQRAGVTRFIQGCPKINPDLHAACHLAQPLESLGFFLKDSAACLFPSDADKKGAHDLLNIKGICRHNPYLVIHPGSGGKHKNWPITYWEKFCLWILQNYPQYPLLCVGGEADQVAIKILSTQLSFPRLFFCENFPLPILTALLSKAYAFVGHDTGVSHIAAAAGAPCLLLYGPTDPKTWAPTNPLVRVLTSPTGIMEDLPIKTVCQAFESLKPLL